MIKKVTTTESNQSITLSWQAPEFLPKYYTVSYRCKFRHSIFSYIGDQKHLHERATLVVIDNLWPASICSINLRAVYNLASIDHGLDLTRTTLTPCECIKK